MALTKTRTLQEITVIPGGWFPMTTGGELVQRAPQIHVRYANEIDDPDDDTLPVRQEFGVTLEKVTVTHNSDGTQTEAPTDLSGHDPLVQTIAAAVWAD